MLKWIRYWLITGLVLVFFQIVIGGITRLTESGLSITKWEIVTGVVPPLSHKSWVIAFDDYKETPQYKKLNKGMSIGEFKFIYFWEYVHRMWARMTGLIFLFPFLFFVVKKRLSPELIGDLIKVVALAVLAAVFGWIMVASGLINRPWVNAYKLSIHLFIGISVFSYLLWTYLRYIDGYATLKETEKRIKPFLLFRSVLLILFIQIIFGGWMSGMKAALFYPTWPDMNGEFVPGVIFNPDNWNIDNLIRYDSNAFAVSLVQFVHRLTAYGIVILLTFYFYLSRFWRAPKPVRYSSLAIIILVLFQVILGILCLLTAIGSVSVLWGSLHQTVAVLLIASMLIHYRIAFYKSFI